MADGNYIVRDYQDTDYTDILDLWLLTDMGGEERGDTPDIIKQTISMGGKLLVLEVDGLMVGSSWMTQDGRRMYLHHFSIHPEYQGMGLSHMLMNTSLSFMRKIGLQVKLEVHASNEIAVKLYEKHGFKHLDGYQVLIIRELE